jgi:hypothetical protein
MPVHAGSVDALVVFCLCIQYLCMQCPYMHAAFVYCLCMQCLCMQCLCTPCMCSVCVRSECAWSACACSGCGCSARVFSICGRSICACGACACSGCACSAAQLRCLVLWPIHAIPLRWGVANLLITKPCPRVNWITSPSPRRQLVPAGPTGREGNSIGRISNLISTDAEAIQSFCGSMFNLWSSPVRIVVAIVLLYVQIGSSATCDATCLGVARTNR